MCAHDHNNVIHVSFALGRRKTSMLNLKLLTGICAIQTLQCPHVCVKGIGYYLHVTCYHAIVFNMYTVATYFCYLHMQVPSDIRITEIHLDHVLCQLSLSYGAYLHHCRDSSP